MDNVLAHVELVLLVHLLGHDTMAFTIRLALIPAECAAVAIGADAVVTLLDDLLVLAVEEVRLGAEHPGNADEGEKKEEHLHSSLSRVELLVGVDLKEVGDQRPAQRKSKPDEHFQARGRA